MVIVKNSCAFFQSARCETSGMKSRMPAIDRPDNLHLLSRGRVYAPHRRFIINTLSQLPFRPRCTKIIISIPWFWPGFSKQPRSRRIWMLAKLGQTRATPHAINHGSLWLQRIAWRNLWRTFHIWHKEYMSKYRYPFFQIGDMIENLNMYYWIFFRGRIN